MQQAFNFDPSARKHKNNPQSRAAHKKVVPTKEVMWQLIMGFADSRGEYGITLHEVAGALGKEKNEISGRLSELKMKGWLHETGAKRNGAAVLRAK